MPKPRRLPHFCLPLRHLDAALSVSTCHRFYITVAGALYPKHNAIAFPNSAAILLPFLDQLNNPQPGQSTCNVTDDVLRVQCQSGSCQTYSWLLSSCQKACAEHTSDGRKFSISLLLNAFDDSIFSASNSSTYICSSNCQTVTSPSQCSPPPSEYFKKLPHFGIC